MGQALCTSSPYLPSDWAFLICFTIECLLSIVAYGVWSEKKAYFRSLYFAYTTPKTCPPLTYMLRLSLSQRLYPRVPGGLMGTEVVGRQAILGCACAFGGDGVAKVALCCQACIRVGPLYKESTGMGTGIQVRPGEGETMRDPNLGTHTALSALLHL